MKVAITPELRRRLKVRAAIEDTTQGQLAARALTDLLDRLDSGATLPDLDRFEDVAGRTQHLDRLRLTLDDETTERLSATAGSHGVAMWRLLAVAVWTALEEG